MCILWIVDRDKKFIFSYLDDGIYKVTVKNMADVMECDYTVSLQPPGDNNPFDGLPIFRPFPDNQNLPIWLTETANFMISGQLKVYAKKFTLSS